MIQYEQWNFLRGQFNRQAITEHFIVYFFDRHPENGPVHPVHGIRDRRLVTECVVALENCYRLLQNELGDQRLFAPGGRVPVYLFSVGDCLDGDELLRCAQVRELYIPTANEIYPVILLPARSRDPDFRTEIRALRANVAHELAHVFNARHRWARRISSNGGRENMFWKYWVWLNEGIAVSAEHLAYPAISDWIGLVREWMDHPEWPLDYSGYAAGMFVHYLRLWGMKRGEPGLPGRLWTPAFPRPHSTGPADFPFKGSESTPATVLNLFRELGTNFHDFFLNYCTDSWFIADEAVWPNGLHRVGERYHERGLSHSSVISAEEEQLLDGEGSELTLEHLSTRYFRFGLPRSPCTVGVAVHERSPRSIPLQASLSLSATETGLRLKIPVILQSVSGEPGCLHGRIDTTGVQTRTPVSLIVTVANCGCRDSEEFPARTMTNARLPSK